MLRLLAVHPGPDISVAAAASMTGTSVAAARRALTELAASYLVGSQMEINPPEPGVSTDDITDHAGALAWFESQRHVLIVVIAWAAEHRQDWHLGQIAWLIDPFFDRRGYWYDWAGIIDMQLSAARRLGDLDAEARTHHSFSQLLGRLGAYDDARIHLDQALRIYQDSGDEAGQARVHISMAWLYDAEGHYREVLEHSTRAADLYQAAGHRVGQVDALGAIGWTYGRLGDHEQSLVHCERALELYREMGSEIGQANTLDIIATAHHHLGNHTQAMTGYRQAIAMLVELDDAPLRAEVQD